MSWPTTRRFARTVGEAFRDAEYSVAIHRTGPPITRLQRWAGYLLACSIGVALALTLAYGD